MVESYKPKHINLDNTEIKKAVDKAKKEGNIRRIRQSDYEQPGGFIKPDNKDIKKEIEGKFRERIHLQEQLREVEIAQQYRYVEAEELEKIFKSYNKLPDKDKPQWYGLPMPKRILVMEVNTKIHSWRSLMLKRNYYYQALKNVGFTTKELEPLLTQGKVISDSDKFRELEEKYQKEQLKRDDVDAV